MAGIMCAITSLCLIQTGRGDRQLHSMETPACSGRSSMMMGCTRACRAMVHDQSLCSLQALASEATARSAHAVSAAARPLQSSLLDTLLPDLMAGLVQVALSRPDDPCQVCV
jgi:hypothetical protein